MGKNKPTPQVIIGMPCTEMMKAKTAHAIGCLAITSKCITDFLMMQSCDISASRTWLVRTARQAGYDVWVDPSIKVLHLGEYGY